MLSTTPAWSQPSPPQLSLPPFAHLPRKPTVRTGRHSGHKGTHCQPGLRRDMGQLALLGADLRRRPGSTLARVRACRADHKGTYSFCGWPASGACRWGAAAAARGSRSGPEVGSPGGGLPWKANTHRVTPAAAPSAALHRRSGHRPENSPQTGRQATCKTFHSWGKRRTPHSQDQTVGVRLTEAAFQLIND